MRATRDTIDEAGRTTKAARDAVDETRRIGEAQTRAYVSVVDVSFEIDADKDKIWAHATVANSGATPALDIKAEISVSVDQLADRTPTSMGPRQGYALLGRDVPATFRGGVSCAPRVADEIN